jgi:hypothetical protein
VRRESDLPGPPYASCGNSAAGAGSVFGRLRSGPFEGPATEKPPALPEDAYLPYGNCATVLLRRKSSEVFS